MLGKKSLAIALMGLGLVGSAYGTTPEYSVSQDFTVNFKATVKAAACTFSVYPEGSPASGSSTDVIFTEAPKTSNPAKKLIFDVNCNGATTFAKATVTGNAGEKVSRDQATANSAYFAFYDDDNGITNKPWDSTSAALEFTEQGSKSKWVQFVTTKDAPLGLHEASVKYTIVYE